MRVIFNHLAPLHDRHGAEIEAAIARVVRRSWYVLGPEVESFENNFAQYHNVPHAVGVANGTDAIEISLRAAGIGPGDEVISVAHTAAPTICAIERSGATPVLVDIDAESYTIDPDAVQAAVTSRTKAIVPVHLYGHPADLGRLRQVCDRHGLLMIEDCAQAHGAKYDGSLVGTFGDLAAFSFYPTKNLGAYGDGGAILTRDAELADRIRRFRNYGQRVRYHHDEPGMNSRLDEIQAAILAAKLPHLAEHNSIRRQQAQQYTAQLPSDITPRLRPWRQGLEHAFHLYVIRHPDRDGLQRYLEARQVGTLIHYPVPLHLQGAFAPLRQPQGSLPVTERVASEILSLPLYVGLTAAEIDYVAETIRQFVKETNHQSAA